MVLNDPIADGFMRVSDMRGEVAVIISDLVADYLVTYDRKHLLSYKKEIKTHFKLNVITPDEVVNSRQLRPTSQSLS